MARLFFLQIAERIQIPVTGKRGGNRILRYRHRVTVNGAHERLMIGAQCRGNPRILRIVNEIILQMISAQVTGQALDGQCSKPKNTG